VEKRVSVAGEIVVNSEAFEVLSTLCDKFGSRFFATQEERESAKFLATKLQGYGLRNVGVEAYTKYGWENGELVDLWSWKRESAFLDLMEPIHRQMPCISLPYSPSTSDTGITAEIFNLERGSQRYLLAHRGEIKAKLVLEGNYAQPGEYFAYSEPNGKDDDLYRPTIYGYLEQFGAAGFIYINRSFGGLAKTGTARFGRVGKIPACGVSRETSQFILRQIAKGSVVANLRIKNTYSTGAKSYNVIAELPGQDSENVILVGGHYDGHDIAPGAMDDAAGACVVLETARALAKHGGEFKHTIRFCCFAGEELGLNGSTGYVINHMDELKKIKLMINTDCAGISATTGHSFQVFGPEELTPFLEEMLNEMGTFDRDWELPKVTLSGKMPFLLYGDHWPFYMFGIPTVHFRDIPPDPIDELYSHTTEDTVDKVNVKGIKDAAVILALALLRIADEKEIPARHRRVDDVLSTLEEDGTAEILRVEKRWRRELPS
jgi:hypothetical protein